MSRAISAVLLIISLLLLSYPIAATLWNDHRNQENARRYEEQLTGSTAPDVLDREREEARAYNARLAEAGHPARPEDPADLAYQDYRSRISLPDSAGVMARVIVPSVNVDLPVYHGSTSEVLYRGAGHMYGTDLPVGGEGTTSVITAHTGMVNASMFDNIHELKEGDPIYVSVLGEKLRYRVTGHEVVKPDDYGAIIYTPGVDRLILLTCTPYGINSDRLLVSAERDLTPLQEGELDSGPGLKLSWWMKLDLLVIAMIILIALSVSIRNRRRSARRSRGAHTAVSGRR